MSRISNTCLIVALSVSFACSHKTKPISTVAKPKTVGAVPKASEFNQLYDFLFTTDKNFCDPVQIVAGDCGIGFYYFTKKKNVIFTSQCVGEDTVSYLIGKYSMTPQGITCRFDREYSFYTGESKVEKPTDPNSGKMKKRKSLEFKLGKLKCKDFDFNFISGNNENYVLRKSEGKQLDYFFSSFNKIKAFSGL